MEFRPFGQDANRIFFTTAGQIGLGIVPQGNFHIKSSRAELRIENTNASDAAFLRLKGPGTNFWDICQTGNNTLLEFRPQGQDANRFVIDQSGAVGIGTTNLGTAKLTVAGSINSREVTVTTNAGADFVFANDYHLKPLSEIESFVKQNKHLPGVASESEMKANGVQLGEMNIKLLEKVEELTLYVIELEKKVKALENENKNRGK